MWFANCLRHGARLANSETIRKRNDDVWQFVNKSQTQTKQSRERDVTDDAINANSWPLFFSQMSSWQPVCLQTRRKTT